MTPLENNPDFDPGVHLHLPTTDPDRPRLKLHQLFQQGTLLTFQAMTCKFPDYHIPSTNTYKYVTSLIASNPWQTYTGNSRLLKSYATVSNPSGTLSPPSIRYILVRQWDRDLNIDLTTEDWKHVHNHIHKGSLNISTQENRYKIFTKWYRTPDRIHKFHPNLPPLCWSCNASIGTLLHIWWECPLIQTYWTEIHRLITQITTYSPDFTPAQYLLLHTSLPQHTYKKSLVLHLINAANLCIPVHWRNTSPPPTILEWIQRVDRIAEMENLIHQSSDTPSKYVNIWAGWSHFKSSQAPNTATGFPLTGSEENMIT